MFNYRQMPAFNGAPSVQPGLQQPPVSIAGANFGSNGQYMPNQFAAPAPQMGRQGVGFAPLMNPQPASPNLADQFFKPSGGGGLGMLGNALMQHGFRPRVR